MTKLKISEFDMLDSLSSNVYIAGIRKKSDSTYENVKIPFDLILNKYQDYTNDALDHIDVDGVDTAVTQYIYQCNTQINNTIPTESNLLDGTWSDDLSSIINQFTPGTYILCSYRTKTDGVWGSFCKPFIWAHYGENGKNGDSVEFIFTLSKTIISNTSTYWPSSIVDATGYQKDNCSFENITGFTSWQLNPPTVSTDYPYCYMAKRLKSNDVWGVPSAPALWNIYRENAQSVITSYIFCNSDTQPDTPTGGDFSNTLGSSIYNTWTDGISNSDTTTQVWSSHRIFTSDGKAPQEDSWSTPVCIIDSDTTDTCFSSFSKPDLPSFNPGINGEDTYWHNLEYFSSTTDNILWMAMAQKKSGVWTDWNAVKIKGEDSIATGLVITCNNDTVIVDDDTEDIGAAADCELTLYKNGVAQSDAVFIATDTNLPETVTVTITGNKVTYAGSVPVGVYYLTFKGTIGEESTTYKHVITCKDISTGSVYKLTVSPNIIGADSDGNLLNGDLEFTLTLQEITGDTITNIDLKSTDDYYYNVVVDNNIQASECSYLSGTVSLFLTNMKLTAGTFDSIIINAYKKTSNILIDSETINVVKNGKLGDKGSSLNVLEASWNATIDNDCKVTLAGEFILEPWSDTQSICLTLSDYDIDINSIANSVYELSSDIAVKVQNNEDTIIVSVNTGTINSGTVSIEPLDYVTVEEYLKPLSIALKENSIPVATLSYFLRFPIGYYTTQDASGKTILCSNASSISSIELTAEEIKTSVTNTKNELTSTIDLKASEIALSVESVKKGNIFTNLLPTGTNSWTYQEDSDEAQSLVWNSAGVFEYSYAVSAAGTSITLKITSPEVTLDTNTIYTVSWQNVKCTKVAFGSLNLVINTKNSNWQYATILPETATASITFTISIEDDSSIIAPVSIDSVTPDGGSSEIQSNSVVFKYPKLEIGESPTEWTLSNEDSLTAANLSITNSGLISTVTETTKASLESVSSQIKQTSNSISETVTSQLGTAGFTITDSSTTFTGSIKATDFQVLDGTNTVMELKSYDATVDGTAEGVTLTEGMPIIKIWNGLKCYILNPIELSLANVKQYTITINKGMLEITPYYTYSTDEKKWNLKGCYKYKFTPILTYWSNKDGSTPLTSVSTSSTTFYSTTLLDEDDETFTFTYYDGEDSTLTIKYSELYQRTITPEVGHLGTNISEIVANNKYSSSSNAYYLSSPTTNSIQFYNQNAGYTTGYKTSVLKVNSTGGEFLNQTTYSNKYALMDSNKNLYASSSNFIAFAEWIKTVMGGSTASLYSSTNLTADQFAKFNSMYKNSLLTTTNVIKEATLSNTSIQELGVAWFTDEDFRIIDIHKLLAQGNSSITASTTE